MEHNNVKQNALQYWEQGYHCAEAIGKALWDKWGNHDKPYPVQCASAFCGGIGRCKQDVCGALTGGILVIGSLFGRKKGGENINKACCMAMEFRLRFKNKFGSTNCKVLLEMIEKGSVVANCSDLTSQAADILDSVIDEIEKKQVVK